MSVNKWIKLSDDTCPNRGIEVECKKVNNTIIGEVEGSEEDNGFCCEGETGSIKGF